MNLTPEQAGEQIDLLDNITIGMEQEISNFELVDVEDMYDEEYDEMVRALKWNRGMKNYSIVINTFGQIRYADRKTPANLIVQMTNHASDIVIKTLMKSTPVISDE